MYESKGWNETITETFEQARCVTCTRATIMCLSGVGYRERKSHKTFYQWRNAGN